MYSLGWVSNRVSDRLHKPKSHDESSCLFPMKMALPLGVYRYTANFQTQTRSIALRFMGAKSDKEEASLAKSKASPKKAAQRWMLVDHAPWNPFYGIHGAWRCWLKTLALMVLFYGPVILDHIRSY